MKTTLAAVACIIFFVTCRERYDLPFIPANDSYLVVEGNILDGDTTVIRLSRTTALGERGLLAQKGASVVIESENNTAFPLVETEDGVYKSVFLDLQDGLNYRIRIVAADIEYESDFTPLINTPGIDTLTWQRNDGLEIFVTSFGSVDQPRYYKWDYEEVWEFRSKYESRGYFTYVMGANGKKQYTCVDVTRDGYTYNTCIESWVPPFAAIRNDSLYRCWKYGNSTNIHIGSTASLSENLVYVPVKSIEEDGWELDELYSINVKQTGLSKESYEFYKILESNTESLGSIFDAQPSELKTNIRCVTDPSQRVIGFVDATTVTSKRLFISNSELPDWNYELPGCDGFTKGANIPDSIQIYLGFNLVPVEIDSFEESKPNRPLTFKMAPRTCVDCTVRGVHLKPDFWPR